MMTLSFLFQALSFLFRMAGELLRFWPLLLIVLLFTGNRTPHIRWSYSYIPHGGYYSNYRTYTRCDYLGVKGLVNPGLTPDCPFLALINPDDSWR
jgi:hypothetical protein